jgi:ABC-type polar amino acid transport system ATPase subunit
MIRAEGIHKSYGALEVLKGVSLEVEAGSVVAMIGLSGSGKSTFLRCLNGLEPFSAGTVQVDGISIAAGTPEYSEALRELRIKLGMVFQQFQLFPHMSVLDNIVLAPMRVQGKSQAQAAEYAMELLRRMGLEAKAHSRTRELSGGQQQRVAIARALAMKPSGLLFDEPTSALDPSMTVEVASLVRELAESGLAVLVVTHDMNFARRVSDRLVVFEKGVIVEEGPTADLFAQPQSIALKTLIDPGQDYHADPKPA